MDASRGVHMVTAAVVAVLLAGILMLSGPAHATGAGAKPTPSPSPSPSPSPTPSFWDVYDEAYNTLPSGVRCWLMWGWEGWYWCRLP